MIYTSESSYVAAFTEPPLPVAVRRGGGEQWAEENTSALPKSVGLSVPFSRIKAATFNKGCSSRVIHIDGSWGHREFVSITHCCQIESRALK